MTSLERIRIVMDGGVPDTRPIVPEVFGVTARINGYSVYQYVTDGRILAESQFRAQKEIGYDVLFAFADLLVEAEAIGCRLRYNEDRYPYIVKPFLDDLDSLKELTLPDPEKDGRMPVVVEAARRLRDYAGNGCLIAACVVGPLTLASHLLGLERFLYKLVEEPERIIILLDYSEKVMIRYGEALLRAGAHCIIVFDPIASPDVIPSSYFLNLESPKLKRAFSYFSRYGLPISWLSIAGPTERIIPYYRESGVNLATIDYEVPIDDALSLCNDIVINGNLKPYDFVSSDPDNIKDIVKDCFAKAAQRRNFIIGSGCEIPIEAKAENIIALVRATRENY